MLALTDHDEVSGLAEARAAATGFGITLIDGVEISVTWQGHTIHVVGLGIDSSNEALKSGLAATRGGRQLRAEKMAAALDELGIGGSAIGAREFAANGELLSRTHFARFLVKTGAVKDMQSAFTRFLGAGRAAYVAHEWARLEDAVRWITGSGGAAVIAHPGRYILDSAEMRALLGEFRDHGGAAIEVVTSSHKPQQYAQYAAHAKQFGFAGSAGSDFHSPDESYHDLGSLPALPPGVVPVWQQLGI